jgi:hypothetical protein
MAAALAATRYDEVFSQVSPVESVVAPALPVAAEPLPSNEVPGSFWAWVALIAVFWATWYVIACWYWPFARCVACKGQGRKYQSERRKTWRNCRWCKGSGRRRRWGRIIWSLAHRERT